MKLLIISPQHQEIHIVEWLEVNTPQGNMIVKIGHAPMIATLAPHSSMHFLLKSGETLTVDLDRPGFLEVERNSVTVLLNQTNK